jgi:outer membrane biosynthesis protein TonB
MSSLDNLPGDQRAVLEMVLKRGRSYAEIASLLKLDPAAVRERAQIALDAIGPHTGQSPAHQHRVADYLLGQLSDSEAQEVRDVLADSPSDRGWARVVASELATVAGDNPLPEIPTERSAPREPEPPVTDPPAAEPLVAPTPPPPPAENPSGLGPAQPDPEPKRRRGRRKPDEPVPPTQPTQPAPPAPPGGPRSSRVGGALLLVLGVVVVGAVLFFVLRSNHSSNHTDSSSATSTPAPAAGASSTTTASGSAATSGSGTATTTGSSSAKVVSQINLSPPSSDKGSKSAGIAEVLNEGSTDGVAIVAQNVPANTTKPPNAYAVWLYNSPEDAKILGFVNPGVDKSGRLSTAGALPSNASHYKELIVTVETTASPKVPGQVILQGALSTNL